MNIDNPIAVSRGLCLLECGDRIGVWAEPGRGCELTDPRTVKVYKAVKVMERLRAKYLLTRKGVTVTVVK